MVQAARSGVQNIAEGSMAGGTSRKTEIRLTNVAKASLEELRLDYEDFLRQRGLDEWSRDDPRRRQLTQQRCRTADEVAEWVVHAARRAPGERPLLSAGVPETSANAVLVLIGVTTTLLRRQLATQTKAFQAEGGFTERLYRTRHERREGNP
jgi:four helix bundle suffix protein